MQCPAPLTLGSCEIFKGYLEAEAQKDMRDAIREVIRAAPLFSPMTPWGKPMRVKMSSAGKYGWYSDKKGYRYEPRHPGGQDWPPIPECVLDVWRARVSGERLPDCCLINYYREGTKMGLHQDKDEADFSWPVLSISLGDSALFRIGGTARKDPTSSVELESGDVLIMGGDARLAFHGIDRIRFGSSTLLENGGRLNLTLRVVD